MRKTILALLLCVMIPLSALSQSIIVYTPKDGRGAPFEKVETVPGPPFTPGEDLLSVDFIFMGMGDCILLRCGGETMLVDGGMAVRYADTAAFLDYAGVSGFTYMLNTHCHADHISGLYKIVRQGYPVGTYMAPYDDEYTFSDEQIKMRALLDEKGIPYRKISSGDRFTLGNAEISVYRDERPLSDKNMHSVVLLVAFGQRTILLTADIGPDAEMWLLSLYGIALKADIIKWPHHGYMPVNTEFLDTVSPQLAIITNNRLVTKDVDRQLARRGIPRYYTHSGHVRLLTNGILWHAEQMIYGEPGPAR